MTAILKPFNQSTSFTNSIFVFVASAYIPKLGLFKKPFGCNNLETKNIDWKLTKMKDAAILKFSVEFDNVLSNL